MSFLDVLRERKLVKGSSSEVEGKAQKAGKSLESYLVEEGVPPTDILEAKGEFFRIPTRSLKGHLFDPEVLSYIPEESVRHYGIIPLGVVENVLEVGVVDPDNIEARDALQFISTRIGLPYKLFLITQEDFEKTLENYKSLSGEVHKALSELETEISGGEKIVADIESSEKSRRGEVAKIVEDAPVTKIVGTIIKYAIDANASDVHIEPTEENVRVRFRIDGALETRLVLPIKVHPAVVARIKILANMRLDEKRKPQDNRFSTSMEGREIDFRVSTFPAYYGEKVVMRILDPVKGVFKLDEMGFSKRDLKLVRGAIREPYGLILITGPTGSGKTTTLYAMLQEIDRERQNVLSLEDPVEYSIPGMNQSQVRPEIGYSFASGLRTTLRQDPDVIMVGEIRDSETAGLALQAALTGHLVLSTLHTNDTVGVVPRLLDMGIEPYLLPPTLILTIAQRLVRKICPSTGKKVSLQGELRETLERQFKDIPEEFKKGIQFPKEVLEIEPTKECPSGTKGRTAVYEVLRMNRDLERVIVTNPSEAELMKVARAQGMFTMKEDAILKAFSHLIPFSEVGTVGNVYDVE